MCSSIPCNATKHFSEFRFVLFQIKFQMLLLFVVIFCGFYFCCLSIIWTLKLNLSSFRLFHFEQDGLFRPRQHFFFDGVSWCWNGIDIICSCAVSPMLCVLIGLVTTRMQILSVGKCCCHWLSQQHGRSLILPAYSCTASHSVRDYHSLIASSLRLCRKQIFPSCLSPSWSNAQYQNYFWAQVWSNCRKEQNAVPHWDMAVWYDVGGR